MKNDKRNIGRDPHIAPGVYYIQKELCARIDGDRIIVEKKESEDESTRKALIETVKCIYAGDTMFLSEQQRDRYLAYLEKQKEQKPNWKPSEEQMKALLNAEGFLRAGLQHDSAKTIAELYEQLKKL